MGFEVYLRTIRYGIKIIFCGHSKPLSVEIMKNGWRPAECQIKIALVFNVIGLGLAFIYVIRDRLRAIKEEGI